LAALADPIRARLLLVLDRHELTVNELCAVLQLPQSTVSRHLKTLTGDGWAVSRRDGTSRYYAFADLAPSERKLWGLVREQIAETPAAGQDDRRLRSVLAGRRSKTQEFFASAAGQWDKLRTELFGGAYHLQGLLGLLDERWVVGDLGCGTGSVAEAVAPFVKKVVAVDESAAMLQAARRRLRETPNVDVRRGAIEALPFDDGELDAALLFLVLHHLPEPGAALAEVARAVTPGGRLVVVDMQPHDRQEYRRQMGHVWLGFAEAQVRRYLHDAGFDAVRVTALPPGAAKGPALFAASARKTLSASKRT
jgi:ArsR family transcriptional regulator